MRPSSPKQALADLIELFPGFRAEWETFGEGVDLTYHSVMMSFTQYFGSAAAASKPRLIAALGVWLSEAVSVDDELENAVSTCLFEHVHQIKVANLLKPHLSARARERLRA